jgi:hypothetical protein
MALPLSLAALPDEGRDIVAANLGETSPQHSEIKDFRSAAQVTGL